MASTVLLRHLLGAGGDLGTTTPLIGVEHELQAHEGTALRDFRTLLPTVVGPVLLSDPGDPRARRLRSGLALTADGWEAELVTPPLPLDAAAPGALARMLAEESSRLLAALRRAEPTTRLTGFSTHINVSAPDSVVLDVAREFATRFAAATMLLLERPESPGLLVRPRRGRLEVGGEYAHGEDLIAAVTFVAAAVSHLLSRAPHTNGTVGEGSWTVEPARERFGHFVPACGVAPDLYASGRRCLLRHGGAWVTGQQHLESVWSVVRAAAITMGLDPAPVDRRVAGLEQLPLEHGEPTDISPGPGDGADLEVLEVLGAAAQARERGTLLLEPVWLTWSTVAWRCEDSRSGRRVHLVMPVADERLFLERLDSGRLDTVLRVCLRRRIRPAQLVNSAQAKQPGVWTTVRPEALVPAERGADGMPMSGGPGRGQGDEAKERHDERDPSLPRSSPSASSRRRSWWVAGAAAGLLAAGGVAAAVALNGSEGDSGGPVASASPTAARPPISQGPAPAPVTPTEGSETGVSGGSVEFAGVFTSACDPAAPACDTYVEPEALATLVCEGDACTISISGLEGFWSPAPSLSRTGPTSFTGADVNFCDQPVTITVELVGSTLSMEQVGGSSPPSCWSGTNTFEGEHVAGDLSGWAP